MFPDSFVGFALSLYLYVVCIKDSEGRRSYFRRVLCFLDLYGTECNNINLRNIKTLTFGSYEFISLCPVSNVSQLRSNNYLNGFLRGKKIKSNLTSVILYIP